MKVALVIFRCDDRLGGAERYTIDLASRLTSRGLDVSVLAREFHGLADARTIVVPTRGITRRSKFDSFDAGVTRLVGDHRFDVVHAMMPVSACDLYHPHAGFEVASLARVPAWRRALLAKRRAFASVERAIVARGAEIIALTHQQKRDAIDRLNAVPGNVHVVFNGIDLDRFVPPTLAARRESRARLGLLDSQVMVLFVGQDFARKGLDRVVWAISRLKDDRLRLHVAGEGTPIEASFATYHGAQRDVLPLFHAADMLVLASRSDPFGLVAGEAMAVGIPAVVSDACGAAEAMIDGIHGSVVPNTDDPEPWARAVAYWVDPTHRLDARSALASHRASLGVETHVDRILACYRSVNGPKTAR
jgi:UDP-glucose:(heptosyl)LPS alpha-1,3-glucosyltransferase